MKKLLMAVAAALLAAQAGYCDGPALEGLKTQGDAVTVSVPAAGLPASDTEGNNILSDDALAKLDRISGATPFEKLKNLFNGGVPAVRKDMTGWYAGRTVSSQEPWEADGALLIGKEEPIVPDGGPLLSEELKFTVRLVAGATSGYFDDMAPSVIAGLQKTKVFSSIIFPAATGSAPREYGKVTLRYRRSLGYLVEHMISLDKLDNVRWETYSYYFLNVTPKQ